MKSNWFFLSYSPSILIKAWTAKELPTDEKYGGHSLHSANHQHPGPSTDVPPKKLKDETSGTNSVFAILTVCGDASFEQVSNHWAESPNHGVFQSHISLIRIL